MIIKRQKLYTFAEKKMWRELYRNTNGWRDLPKGWKNMTSRDTFRLGNIASGYYNGKINPEDIQILATHLGLPQTAKVGDKVLRKYTDPKLLERYRSIRAHKLGVGKEYEEFNSIVSEFNNLQNSARSKKELQKKQDEFINRVRDRYNELYNKLGSVIGPEKERNISKIEKHISRQGDLLRSSNKEFDSLPEVSNPELGKKVSDYIRKKHGIRYITLDEAAIGGDSWADQVTKGIHLSEKNKFNPYTLSHEAGHLGNVAAMEKNTGLNWNQLSTRAGNIEVTKGVKENSILPVANEYAASRRGLNILDKVGAGEEQKAEMIKEMTPALKGYYHKAVGETPLRFYERL